MREVMGLDVCDSINDTCGSSSLGCKVDRGVRVITNDVFAVPLHSTIVRDAITRLTLLFGLQVLADNVRRPAVCVGESLL